MNYEEITKILKTASELGVSSIEINEGNLHVAVTFASKGAVTQEAGATETTVSAVPAAAQISEQKTTTKAVQEEAEGYLVKAPLVGVFYASAVENGEPLVKVGDTVKAGQPLAIIEAMKLMNEIEAEKDGIVTEVLVGNNESVEYGQPLFRIREV